MILVGARFRALAGARAALRAVRASVAVLSGDVGVRALGTTRYETPTEEFVVAGRFEPDDVETVIRILHTHGGRIVVRRFDGSGQLTPRIRRAAGPGSRKRLRRPSPPRRVRTARSHRIAH